MAVVFPIYGKTAGGDFVRIISEMEAEIVIMSESTNQAKTVVKAACYQVSRIKSEASVSQYYVAYLSGNLQIITEQEFDAMFVDASDKISR